MSVFAGLLVLTRNWITTSFGPLRLRERGEYFTLVAGARVAIHAYSPAPRHIVAAALLQACLATRAA